MIPRYTTPEMKKIWSEKNKFSKWLEVELAVLKALEELQKIPSGTSEAIRKKAKINVDRIIEIEKETEHDVVAFVKSIIDQVGDEGRWFHFGMTSSDVVDTALSLLLKEALQEILRLVDDIILSLKEMALRESNTLMIGRTHGVHAEPITFGHKLSVWAFEMARNRTRLQKSLEQILIGKISGAVGTYSNLSPEVEKIALKSLGLTPEPASTQIIQRDRHAQIILSLALTASSLDKFATEIRHLQKTEVLELQEPFKEKQKGSSAMPHKKNPVICERISGLARLLRGYAVIALENIPLWHERDISHSSPERIIFPDATTALHYSLKKFLEILEGLKIDRARMKKNLELTGGLVFSSRVLTYLIEKGLSRTEAYDSVQRCALRAWENKETDFAAELLKDETLKNFLSKDELEKIFDYGHFVRYVPEIIKRLEDI